MIKHLQSLIDLGLIVSIQYYKQKCVISEKTSLISDCPTK